MNPCRFFFISFYTFIALVDLHIIEMYLCIFTHETVLRFICIGNSYISVSFLFSTLIFSLRNKH